jgi:hypothetical protein
MKQPFTTIDILRGAAIMARKGRQNLEQIAPTRIGGKIGKMLDVFKPSPYDVKPTVAFQVDVKLHNGTTSTLFAQYTGSGAYSIALYNSQGENAYLRFRMTREELLALSELTKQLPE